MLIAKTFEIRDKGTFFAAVGVLTQPTESKSTPFGQTYADVYLLRRSGYGFDQSLVLFSRLDGDGKQFPYDPFAYQDRTMRVSHEYVTEHWDELESGAVIDVEFILGETTEIKRSEMIYG